MASETNGRALLQSVADAILTEQWQDVTQLLQEHAPSLERQARVRAQKDATTTVISERSSNGLKEVDAKVSIPRSDAAAMAWLLRFAMRVRAVACILFLVSAIFAVIPYIPAFWYMGYIMDDAVAIERNTNVISPEFSLSDLMSKDFWGLDMHGGTWTNKSFRPLCTLTYRLNYWLHGLESSGFHITNALLHVLASTLVGLTATRVLGLPSVWGIVALLFFAFHPVHTENVLYIVGRADVLAVVLGLAALIIHSCFYCSVVRQTRRSIETDALGGLCVVTGEPGSLAAEDSRRRSDNPLGLLLSLPLVAASGLCKETGFMFYGLIIVMEALSLLTVHADLTAVGAGPSWLRSWYGKVWRRIRVRFAIVVAFTMVVFLMRYRHTSGTKLDMSPQDNPISFEPSALVRCLSYAYLHGVYFRLLIWPQFLCYDYSRNAIPSVMTWEDPRLMLSLTTYVAVFGALTASLRLPAWHRRAALISLAILVATFLPASNILFPVGTVIGERLLYLPSVGFCLGITVALHAWFAASVEPSSQIVDKDPQRQRARRGRPQGSRQRPQASTGASAHLDFTLVVNPSMPSPWQLGAVCSAGLLVLGVLAIRTYVRVRVWENQETLFFYDGQAQPYSAKTQFNLGIMHFQRQEFDLAIRALSRSAWADPLSALPFWRIGQIEILRGRFASAEQFLLSAATKFGASLMVRDEEVFHDLAVAQFQNGHTEAATKNLEIALQLNPTLAKGWNNLACALAVGARDAAGALRALRKATMYAPENPQYWANLALLANFNGEVEAASSAWRRALALAGSLPEPRDCTWEFAPAT